MIEVKIGNTVKWRVSEYTFNDPQMGMRSVNMTVRHPSMWVDGIAPNTPDFKDAYVEYKGEKYYISSIRPTGEKNTSTIDYIYTLKFIGAEEELSKRKVRDLATLEGDTFISQGTSFSLYADIKLFAQLISNNLKYYFGDRWTIVTPNVSSDFVNIVVSDMYIWELLLKTYEYFGLRWIVQNNTITIGYSPKTIEHVFDYRNGLTKIVRTAQDNSVYNRIVGTGGTRNLPINYFTNRHPDFPKDPNPINDVVNIRNLMPKCFRDSVIAGTLPYKDYVEDANSIALNGIREGSLPPNEDIYPSIAGVSMPGLGRIDEIVAVEYVKGDDRVFDIWVKDIGFNLADDKYTTTEEAKIGFTSGMLAGYEFVVLAQNGKRVVVEDKTKVFNGVSSKYRIRLIKSEEDMRATNKLMPYDIINAVPGDTFIIYDIEMPHSYVLNAERRLEEYLTEHLNKVKQEQHSFTIEPMDAFFETAELESDGLAIGDKIKSGNKIKLNNDSLTTGEVTLHINNVSIKYGQSIFPKYTITVTDKVQVSGNPISRLQSEIDTLNWDISSKFDSYSRLKTSILLSIKDGVVSEYEKADLKQRLGDFNREKTQIDSAYNVLLQSEYLTGDAKTYIANSKTALDGAYNGVVSAINGAMADGSITDEEKGKIGSALDNYIDKLRLYKEAEEAVRNSFMGIIVLKESLKTYAREKKWTDSSFEAIHGNTYLIPAEKTKLQTAKNGYNDAYNTLTAKIDAVMADGKITPSESQEINATTLAYATALANYLKAEEVANGAIIEERNRQTQEYSERQWNDVKETQTHLEQSLLNFSEGINPITVQAMQLLVGDESLQFYFIESRANQVRVPHIVNFDKATKVVTSYQGILKHMTLGIDSVTLGERNYKIWDIPKFTSQPLTDKGVMWLYAKCSKTSNTGVFVLSKTPIAMEGVQGYYHFLMGMFNAENDGNRSFVSLYGFTEILPGRITVDKMVSPDGKLVIDFINSTIYGQLSLKMPGSNKDQDLGEYLSGVDAKLNDTNTKIDNVDKSAKAKQAELEKSIADMQDSNTSDIASLTDLLNKVNTTIGELQDQVDGEVSNWFYSGAPSATKLPEKEWTTNELKARHIGDTYTSTDKDGAYMGKSWRYTTEFKWQEIHDTLISQALSKAQKAQTTADGKNTTYMVKPTKYEQGDQWIVEATQTVNGKQVELGTVLFATQSSSTFVQAHWVDKLKYTSHTELSASERASKQAWEQYANAQAKLAEETAIANADGKITAEEQARITATETALTKAKEYADAQDALLKTQQEAYADGKVTASEKSAIQTAKAYADLKREEAEAYADGKVTSAETKAIAQARQAYDDAVKKAKELDDEIQIGGRNLALNSARQTRLQIGYREINLPEPLAKDTYYTLQFDLDVYTPPADERFLVYYGYETHLFTWGYIPYEKGLTHYSITLKTPNNDGEYKVHLRKVFLYSHGWRDGRYTISDVAFSNIKMERGTVATDWTPAPEDVQAQIDAINANPPRINPTTKNWEVYTFANGVGQYVDTGRTSIGDAKAPKIVDGYWHEWNGTAYTNTGIKAIGIDGQKGDKGDTGTSNIYFGERKWNTSTFNTYTKIGFSDSWVNKLNLPAPKVGDTIWLSITNTDTGKSGQLYLLVTKSNASPTAKVISFVTDGKDGQKGEPGEPGKDGKDGTSQYTKTIINTKNLDENKYYPVLIKLSTGIASRIAVIAYLGSSGVPSWATHQYGFSVYCEWTSNGSDWGSAPVSRNITKYHRLYTKNGLNPVGSIGQVTYNSSEYIYVRGGGLYYFYTSEENGNAGGKAKLYEQGYEYPSTQYPWKVPVKDSVDSIVADVNRLEGGIGEAKQATTDLRTYTDGTFRDGVVSEQEAKRIGGYVNIVQSEWQGVLARYEKLYTSTLSNANALLNAKVSCAGAVDSIVNYINSAIADGKATKAEVAEVNRRYATYKSAYAELNKQLEIARQDTVNKLKQGLDSTNTLVSSLQAIADTLKEGKLDITDFDTVKYLLNALEKSTQIVGGLMLTNAIAMGNSKDIVTTLISGYDEKDGSFIKAGITDFGKDTEKSNVEIKHDGTGHFGQLHFDNDKIVVAPIGELEKAFMMFGRNVMRETIEQVLGRSDYTHTSNISAMNVPTDGKQSSSFSIANDNSAVTIGEMTLSIPATQINRGAGVQMLPIYLSLDVFIDYGTSNQIQLGGIRTARYVDYGGYVIYPQNSQKINARTFIMSAGTHYITAVATGGGGQVSLFTVTQRYTSNLRQTLFSDRGMRIYGGKNSFVDFNHDHTSSSTFARIGGGLTVDYVDTSGAVLAGGDVYKSGFVSDSFGKYKEPTGGNPSVKIMNPNTKSTYFRVYHSINHSNYNVYITPLNVTYADQPSVISRQPYYFEVRFYNPNGDSYLWGFSFLCVKRI